MAKFRNHKIYFDSQNVEIEKLKATEYFDKVYPSKALFFFFFLFKF